MIEKIACHLPKTVLSNTDLALLYPDWTAEKIFEKTGIRERRVVSEGECASDLAHAAAVQLLSEGADQADCLLFCTQTPDYLLPTTACVLQYRLGLPTSCAALDFNLGCSGYVYGLSLANALLASGAAEKVLFLTADTYSRLVHPLDKSTRTIFGDAGTATLLTRDSKTRLHSFVLGSDGRGAEQLIVRTGGARHARAAQPTTSVDDSGNVRDPSCLFMDGPEIFNFTIKAVPKLVQSVLAKAKLTLGEIDLVVFHQANAFMLEHLRRKLGIPSEKFVINLEYCGNTVSSTIPLALAEALQAGRLRPGMKVLLAGFGVGYSWGGCILEWH
ncbi:MAG: ketoacyl-ACP synthase III [Opitutae bacterium]|nr:ketoacyl-ACP synthase III [Opitutae bacterium]